jgi:hypothetical protein
MAVLDAQYNPEPDDDENDRVEHDFKQGERVYIKGLDMTDGHYGAGHDMVPMVGQVYEIIAVDPYDGAVILGPNEYAFHHEDLLSEKDAIKKKLVGKGAKKSRYRKVEAPDWIKNTLSQAALSGGACNIYYLLYRPKKGEVAKRPTYTQLSRRAKKQSRTVYRMDPAYGWKRQMELLESEMVFPYTCWESSNHACFASLRQQPKYFNHKKYWAGKPPTWMYYKLASKVVFGRGRLHDWEVQAYTELLMKYGLAPQDICLTQLLQEDGMSFRLKNYGMNHLFGMLNCLRYPHEYPIVARQTLYFMQNGFNFYIAFILAHVFGGRRHGSHSLLSTYGWDSHESHPHLILQEAWKLEKYFLKEGPKEIPFVKKSSVDSFCIQSSITAVKLTKSVPVISTWEELSQQKPLYWKDKNLNKE